MALALGVLPKQWASQWGNTWAALLAVPGPTKTPAQGHRPQAVQPAARHRDRHCCGYINMLHLTFAQGNTIIRLIANYSGLLLRRFTAIIVIKRLNRALLA